jgi:hypothetical protein
MMSSWKRLHEAADRAVEPKASPHAIYSTRQRVVVLTFATVDDAEAFDQDCGDLSVAGFQRVTP